MHFVKSNLSMVLLRKTDTLFSNSTTTGSFSPAVGLWTELTEFLLLFKPSFGSLFVGFGRCRILLMWSFFVANKFSADRNDNCSSSKLYGVARQIRGNRSRKSFFFFFLNPTKKIWFVFWVASTNQDHIRDEGMNPAMKIKKNIKLILKPKFAAKKFCCEICLIE